MSVVLSNQEVGPCRHELRIEIPAPAVDAESQRVIAEYRKRARIPGFRKGKAPVGMVRKQFQDEIEQEILDRLLPRYWFQAQAEADLKPLAPPSVSEVELKDGEPLTFLATVETRPDIELQSLEDFDLPERDLDPTDGEIDQAVDEMRRGKGDWKVVEREATQGDRVEAHIIPLSEASHRDSDEGGEEAEAPEAQPVTLEVGHASVWEEFSLAVTGKAAGAETEFIRREGEGDEAVEKAFKVKIDAVRELEMPPADDEFAKSLGGFEDLADLREKIGAEIRRSKTEELQRDRETALLDQLRERHPMGLPEGVVQREAERLVTEYAEGLMRRGIDIQTAEIPWDRMRDDAKPQAEKQVHARLLLDAVAEARELKVDESELEATIAAIARAEQSSTPAVRRALDEAGKLESLRAQLMRRKTIRHLLGEEPQEDAASTDEPPAKVDTTDSATEDQAEP